MWLPSSATTNLTTIGRCFSFPNNRKIIQRQSSLFQIRIMRHQQQQQQQKLSSLSSIRSNNKYNNRSWYYHNIRCLSSTTTTDKHTTTTTTTTISTLHNDKNKNTTTISGSNTGNNNIIPSGGVDDNDTSSSQVVAQLQQQQQQQKHHNNKYWYKKKNNKPLSLQRFYRYMGLETFNDIEINNIYEEICGKHQDVIDEKSLQQYIYKRICELELEHDYNTTKEVSIIHCDDTIRKEYAKYETYRILQLLLPNNKYINNPETANNNNNNNNDTDHNNNIIIIKDEFNNRIKDIAKTVDWKRTSPIISSMLLVGSSVGVITPVMPFIINELQLSTSQYGHIISAFALSKMIGNIPAAIAVENSGRKPYMIYSLLLISVGVGSIGYVSTYESLYICRFITGLGVAALSTAGTLMVTDLSTPYNRASTYAPIMSAFATGTTLGPVLGGYLVDNIGLHVTFYIVGISYLGVALINNTILTETKRQPLIFPWHYNSTKQTNNNNNNNNVVVDSNNNDNNIDQDKEGYSMKFTKQRTEQDVQRVRDVIQDAIGQWNTLWNRTTIRNVLILNTMYWITLSGSQMTLLPLLLTNNLHMSATQVGQVYMGMSLIQIIGNPIFAKLIDQVGKVNVMIGATTLMGTSILSLPYFCPVCTELDSNTLLPLSFTLATWSMGSSMLSTAPLAYIAEHTNDTERAQAIALLRTCGDIGFLIGATGTGVYADWTGSIQTAMQSSASLLLSATIWFTIRQYLITQLEKHNTNK